MSGAVLTDRDFMRMQRYPSPSLFAKREFRLYRHEQSQNDFFALLAWGLFGEGSKKPAPTPTRAGALPKANVSAALPPIVEDKPMKRPRVVKNENDFQSPYMGLWLEPKFKPI